MKILIALFILVNITFFQACTTIECANCRTVVEDSNGNIIKDNETPVEYCSLELSEKESEEPVTLDGKTSYWLCE
ncbi:MAG: hypothetical protein IPO21_05785 [Bacteroidales bacterium]|nr:hypothetical protein [Bacteroidales bacterium]